jgi:hypothetical protein
MHGLKHTKHFQQRAQQRGVSAMVVSALLKYGEAQSSKRGVDSLVFTSSALADIRNDYGLSVFKLCERFKNTYIIMSDDGVLITVARSYRKSIQ